jgi:hypothetical protein
MPSLLGGVRLKCVMAALDYRGFHVCHAPLHVRDPLCRFRIKIVAAAKVY